MSRRTRPSYRLGGAAPHPATPQSQHTYLSVRHAYAKTGHGYAKAGHAERGLGDYPFAAWASRIIATASVSRAACARLSHSSGTCVLLSGPAAPVTTNWASG